MQVTIDVVIYTYTKPSVLIKGADSQDDVFVFNAPQTGLVRAKDSVAVMKGKSKTASDESPSTSSTRLPSQPSKNTFTFVPQASRISTAQVATQVTKKPR